MTATATATATTTGTASADAPAPVRRRQKSESLGQSLRYFLGKATPRIIIPVLAVVAVLRVRAGDWGWRDVVMVAGILAFEPFTEWLIHVYVLHFKPRTVRGRRVDLHAARKHREHHQDPNDPDTSFVPIPDLLGLGAVIAGIMWLVTWSVPVFLTGVVTGLAMLLTYEWTHYLIHTSYKPKGRYYRYIWRAHRLHHFKNEHYWMGVTVHLADHVLGTFPQKSEVENSPTARTLGVDPEG
jgi:hypothetical protein